MEAGSCPESLSPSVSSQASCGFSRSPRKRATAAECVPAISRRDCGHPPHRSSADTHGERNDLPQDNLACPPSPLCQPESPPRGRPTSSCSSRPTASPRGRRGATARWMLFSAANFGSIDKASRTSMRNLTLDKKLDLLRRADEIKKPADAGIMPGNELATGLASLSREEIIRYSLAFASVLEHQSMNAAKLRKCVVELGLGGSTTQEQEKVIQFCERWATAIIEQVATAITEQVEQRRLESQAAASQLMFDALKSLVQEPVVASSLNEPVDAGRDEPSRTVKRAATLPPGASPGTALPIIKPARKSTGMSSDASDASRIPNTVDACMPTDASAESNKPRRRASASIGLEVLSLSFVPDLRQMLEQMREDDVKQVFLEAHAAGNGEVTLLDCAKFSTKLLVPPAPTGTDSQSVAAKAELVAIAKASGSKAFREGTVFDAHKMLPLIDPSNHEVSFRTFQRLSRTVVEDLQRQRHALQWKIATATGLDIPSFEQMRADVITLYGLWQAYLASAGISVGENTLDTNAVTRLLQEFGCLRAEAINWPTYVSFSKNSPSSTACVGSFKELVLLVYQIQETFCSDFQTLHAQIFCSFIDGLLGQQLPHRPVSPRWLLALQEAMPAEGRAYGVSPGGISSREHQAQALADTTLPMDHTRRFFSRHLGQEESEASVAQAPGTDWTHRPPPQHVLDTALEEACLHSNSGALSFRDMARAWRRAHEADRRERRRKASDALSRHCVDPELLQDSHDVLSQLATDDSGAMELGVILDAIQSAGHDQDLYTFLELWGDRKRRLEYEELVDLVVRSIREIKNKADA